MSTTTNNKLDEIFKELEKKAEELRQQIKEAKEKIAVVCSDDFEEEQKETK